MAEDRRLTKWDYVYYALWIGSAIGFAMWFIGWLGERLGWWNDVGEVLVGVGQVGGLALAAVAVVVGASRSQVNETAAAVRSNGRTLESVDGKLESVDSKLGNVDNKLESVDGKLDTLDTKLDKLDKLDGIQHALDEQTLVLQDIRDHL